MEGWLSWLWQARQCLGSSGSRTSSGTTSFPHSRAFPAHLVLLVTSAFSARQFWSYDLSASVFAFPKMRNQSLRPCCCLPSASSRCVQEAGTALPAKGGLRALTSVTQQLVTNVLRRYGSVPHRRGQSWRVAWLRLVLCGLLQAARMLPHYPSIPWLPVITRCLSSSALIGCSSGYLHRICTAWRAT